MQRLDTSVAVPQGTCGSGDASSPPGAPASSEALRAGAPSQGCREQAYLERETRTCRAEPGGFRGLLVVGPRL